jgi:hypothetical protein
MDVRSPMPSIRIRGRITAEMPSRVSRRRAWPVLDPNAGRTAASASRMGPCLDELCSAHAGPKQICEVRDGASF